MNLVTKSIKYAKLGMPIFTTIPANPYYESELFVLFDAGDYFIYGKYSIPYSDGSGFYVDKNNR